MTGSEHGVKECYSCESSDERKGLVASGKHTRLVVAQDQLYLGRATLITSRHVPLTSNMGVSERIDWIDMICRYEKACMLAFGATHLTDGNLNNHAHAAPVPNPHLHAHLRPRYAEPVEFAGQVFEDPNFGAHHLHGPENVALVSDEVLEEITATLSDAWSEVTSY